MDQPEPHEEIVPLFVPALIALMEAAETQKRAPLTEAEVTHIRDNATTVMLPASTALAMTASRGYADIDAEHCWEQWQAFRTRTGGP